MKQVSLSLQEYTEQNILPLYEGYDRAHGPEHVRTVIQNSMELAEGLDVDPDMVYTAAVYHDVGICYGREHHEAASGKWLWEDKNLERWFSLEKRQIMREAVEDHRASRQEPPRNLYGRILSEADRDLTPDRIVRRCIEYGLDKFPQLTEQEQVNRVIEHIREKYGKDGYLHLWLPCPKNEHGLAVLREWLETGELRRKCETCLKEREQQGRDTP